MPHVEFTEKFIIIKVLITVTIKHKTIMKCEVKTHAEILDVECNAMVDTTLVRPLNKSKCHSFWY